MDCRISTLLAGSLLSIVSGCYFTDPKTPTTQPIQPPITAHTTPYNATEPSADGPPIQPKANTCVRGGDFLSAESRSPRRSFDQRAELVRRAETAYEQAISIDPNHLPAYQGLAKLYVEQKDYQQALSVYDKSLKIDPNSDVLWFEKGMCQLKARQWEAALASLGKAVDLRPDNKYYVNTLGYALARVNRFDESYLCFCRVNDDATAHFKVARMLRHVKENERAMWHLQQAVKANPHYQDAHEMMVQMQQNTKPNISPTGVERVEHQTPSAPTPIAPAPKQSNLQSSAPAELRPEIVQSAKPYSASAIMPVILPPPPVVQIKYAVPEVQQTLDESQRPEVKAVPKMS